MAIQWPLTGSDSASLWYITCQFRSHWIYTKEQLFLSKNLRLLLSLITGAPSILWPNTCS